MTIDVLLTAARAWVAAADTPQFLLRLANWLTELGWGKSPPQRYRPQRERADQRPPRLRQGLSPQGGGEPCAGFAATRR